MVPNGRCLLQALKTSLVPMIKQCLLVCLIACIAQTAAADERLDEAMALLEDEKYKEASIILKPIVKREIGNIDAWLLLGAAYEGQGLEKKGAQCLQ